METLYDLILNLTSFASLSRSAFLSQDLKVSKVLVLYNVPKAGQQRAGIEAFLEKRRKTLGINTVIISSSIYLMVLTSTK